VKHVVEPVVKHPENNQPVVPNFSPEAVQTEVERILASDKFSRSKRLRSLLQFTVSQTLEGHADTLKEYVIGTEVLKKPDSYDPRRDSLVRVLASRLRMKLREYYNNGGSDDPLVIEFPKGKYVPRFQRRDQLQTEMQRRLAARNAYSRGKFLLTHLTPQNLAESIERFGEAAAAEPDWPPPRVEHAIAGAFEGFLGYRRPREAWTPVRAQADVALQLDEMSAEAHIALGMFYAFFGWRWREAESHFLKAIERDSYSGGGHLWRAIGILLPFGKLREADEELSKARQLAAAPFLEEGQLLAQYLSGRHDDVIRTTESTEASHDAEWRLQVDPEWRSWMRGSALAAAGRMREAIDLLNDIQDPGTHVTATLAHCCGVANDPDRARDLDAQLEARRQSGEWVPNYDRAVIAAGLGEPEEAMARIQEACRENEPWMAFLSLDPRMVSLRSIPRFGGFIRRVLSSETGGNNGNV
jgi:tetratricopeptide (TPR) repeat protein